MKVERIMTTSLVTKSCTPLFYYISHLIAIPKNVQRSLEELGHPPPSSSTLENFPRHFPKSMELWEKNSAFLFVSAVTSVHSGRDIGRTENFSCSHLRKQKNKSGG